MKRLLRDVAVCFLLTLVAGTAYIAGTGKLEFWIRPSRYPDALICRKVEQPRSGSVHTSNSPETPGVGSARTQQGKSSRAEPAGNQTSPPSLPGSAAPAPETQADSREHQEGPIRWITFEEAEQLWRDGVAFIDARPPEAYRQGHIPGALSLPAWEPGLEEKITELAQQGLAEEPVVVYCTAAKECEDSKIVAKNLVEFNFPDVSIYQGGVEQWAGKEKMPLLKGEEPGPRGPQYEEQHRQEKQ